MSTLLVRQYHRHIPSYVCSVRLSRHDVLSAEQYAEKIAAIVAGYGPNYTGKILPDKERYFVGRCGELGLSKWAEQYGLPFIDTVNEDGLSDKQDMIFTKTGYTVDVKNSHHPYAKFLMQPEVQAQKRSCDLIMGATGMVYESGEADIHLWGCAPWKYWLANAERVQGKCNGLTLQILLKDLPFKMDMFLRLVR